MRGIIRSANNPSVGFLKIVTFVPWHRCGKAAFLFSLFDVRLYGVKNSDFQPEGILAMGQFGEELRKERVSRGVALETISEKTKVVTRYLCALEDEHFEILPGGILSKGIVRGYAKTVGLDEATWVERFLVASREHGLGENDGWTEFVQNVGRSRPRDRHHGAWWRRWSGVGLLLLILASFGSFMWQYVGARTLAEAAQPHSMSATFDGAAQQ
jgi:cytoskeleton protein RodZ